MIQKSTIKLVLSLSIFLIAAKFSSAQTVSFQTFTQKETINSKIINIESQNDNSFNFKNFKSNIKNLTLGVQLLIEDELPEDNFNIKDLISYTFGLNYELKTFEFALVVENFFNILNREFLIEPAYMAVSEQVNLIQLEPQTAYLISASVKINLF